MWVNKIITQIVGWATAYYSLPVILVSIWFVFENIFVLKKVAVHE